ncbi:hypothetical protein [Salegentibacter chungangensis]|uniref:Sugar transporter n=1 Tax=Salegentibacter chungangensis TaxID=1335724 RepID=A0ABW3NST4_9FLAO
METQVLSSKVPVWFWILSSILLLWNIAGVISFFEHMGISEETLQAMPEGERVFYDTYPVWALIAFALAVFGGTLGCVGLLLRQKWAKALFIISLIGVLVQMIHTLLISGATETYGPGGMIMSGMIIAIAIFLVWFAGYGTQKGWLK